MTRTLITLAVASACGAGPTAHDAFETVSPFGKFSPWTLSSWAQACPIPLRIQIDPQGYHEGLPDGPGDERVVCEPTPTSGWSIGVDGGAEVTSVVINAPDERELRTAARSFLAAHVSSIVRPRFEESLFVHEPNSEFNIQQLHTPWDWMTVMVLKPVLPVELEHGTFIQWIAFF